MVRINYLPTEFNEVKQSIIEAYKNDPRSFFKDYFQNYSEGSMLANVIDVFAYITTYFNYMTSIAANEAFIHTAQLEKNVYSLAKTLGYSPRRMTSATIDVRFTLPESFDEKYKPVHSVDNVYIPIYTMFRSGRGKLFSLMSEVKFEWDTNTTNLSAPKWRAVRVIDGETIYDGEVGEVGTGKIYRPLYWQLKQGFFEARTYKSDGSANQQIVIERHDIDDSRDSLYIFSTVNNERWEEITSLLDVSSFTKENNLQISNLDTYASAPIYILNTTDKGIQITFGDNVFGKIPEADDILFLRYFITDGADGNYEKTFSTTLLFSYTSSSGVSSWKGTDLIVSYDLENYPEGSIGGADKQTVDSIRLIAPIAFNSQDRIVNESDYEVYLRKQTFVTVDDVKIISGHEYNPPFLGGVVAFLAKQANSVENSFLSLAEKEILTNYLQTKNIAGAESVLFADPVFVYIFINGVIYYNSTVFSEASVRQQTLGVLDSYFNSLKSFASYYKESKLVGALTNSIEIDHVDITHRFSLLKKCTPDIMLDDIVVDLGNRINKGSIRNYSYFSTATGLGYENYLLRIDGEVVGQSNYEYLFDLYDNDGGVYLRETVRRKTDKVIVYTPITANIGTIDYTTGVLHFHFNMYELLRKRSLFYILRLENSGVPYYSTLVDVLLQRQTGTTPSESDKFFLFFGFDTHYADSFKSNGSLLIKNIGNMLEYRGEKF